VRNERHAAAPPRHSFTVLALNPTGTGAQVRGRGRVQARRDSGQR